MITPCHSPFWMAYAGKPRPWTATNFLYHHYAAFTLNQADGRRRKNSCKFHGGVQQKVKIFQLWTAVPSAITVASILCQPHQFLQSCSHPLKWHLVCHLHSAWVHENAALGLVTKLKAPNEINQCQISVPSGKNLEYRKEKKEWDWVQLV